MAKAKQAVTGADDTLLNEGEGGAGEIEQVGAAEQAQNVTTQGGDGAEQTPVASGMVRALVLRACGYGEAGDVVELAAAEAATGVAQGALDDNEAATAAVRG
jgi:hypothetical protein